MNEFAEDFIGGIDSVQKEADGDADACCSKVVGEDANHDENFVFERVG